MKRIAYLLPGTELHGGIRVPIEQAQELARRGYSVEIWSPGRAPGWHATTVPFIRADVFNGELPSPDICVATFWTTVAPACATGADRVFHLCQGFEGVHREYAPLLASIDRAYRLPTEKLVVSPHLGAVLEKRYGIESRLIGTGIDPDIFRPGPPRTDSGALRIGVVGDWGIRPKGVREVLSGLRTARAEGLSFELWRASPTGCTKEERDLGLDPRFFAELSTTAMAGFYHSIDCLIHGSWNEEGFGLPPLEAGACGCAVAATDIEPMAAFSPDALLRFPPGQPAVIPGVVQRLTSPEIRARLARRMRENADALTIQAVVDRLESVLNNQPAARAFVPHTAATPRHSTTRLRRCR